MALHIVSFTNLLGLFISQYLDTAGRLPVELHIGLLAGLVYHLEGVHAKALHVAPVCRDASGAQKPHQLSTCTGRVSNEDGKDGLE